VAALAHPPLYARDRLLYRAQEEIDKEDVEPLGLGSFDTLFVFVCAEDGLDRE